MKVVIFFSIMTIWSMVLSNMVYASEKVSACDTYAADPYDKAHAWADGVEDDDILLSPALKACDKAVRAYPTEARFYFQLGRVYYNKGKNTSDINLLIHAQKAFLLSGSLDKTYGAPLAYLGIMFARGLYVEDGKFIENESIRIEKATFYFELAHQRGYESAQALYDEMMTSSKDFDVNSLHLPTLVYSLYLGDFARIPDNFESRKLISNLLDGFNGLCDKWSVVTNDTQEFAYARMVFGYPLIIDKADKMKKHLPLIFQSATSLFNETLNIDLNNLSMQTIIALLAQYNTLMVPLQIDTDMVRPTAKMDGVTLAGEEFLQCANKKSFQFINNVKNYMLIASKNTPEKAKPGENSVLFEPAH